jgi:hypothetical protein
MRIAKEKGRKRQMQIQMQRITFNYLVSIIVITGLKSNPVDGSMGQSGQVSISCSHPAIQASLILGRTTGTSTDP